MLWFLLQESNPLVTSVEDAQAGNTVEVSTLSLDTWVSIGALATVTLTIVTIMLYSFAKLDKKIDTTRTEVKSDIGTLRTELKTDISELRVELKTDISELRTELKTDFKELRTELRTEFTADLAAYRAESRSDLAVAVNRLETSIFRLDTRVFELAASLRHRPLVIPPQ